MPGVIDCFSPTELPNMLAHNLTILDHLNQAGGCPDRCRLPGYFRVSAVGVAIIADQAGPGYPVLLLNIPGKRSVCRYQTGLFFLEHLPDGLPIILGMITFLADRNTLIRKPSVQLCKILEPGAGSKQRKRSRNPIFQ